MPRRYVKKNLVRKYNENDISMALQSIAEGSSIRKAANLFHVPFTTLYRHSNGEIMYKTLGRPTKFSAVEEMHLVQAAICLQVI